MISIGTAPVMPPPGTSPRDQVASTLEAKVETGEISAEDSEAMLSALDAMHEERKASGPPDFASGPPSREELTAKFDSLLSGQVDAGTLSQDQADQLSTLFEDGEIGPQAHHGGFSNAGGQDLNALVQEFMASVLELVQTGTSYDQSGEASSSNSAAILADFKV
ncbi:hypothetical protein [uncultured Roseibium sp.]|uniref:hypothetical protein n=1 Tax=uncultured Roseibium sp. TaxID=1936171 RepID=UPI0026069367|nr:hypothetical protein [uncultured Roseibium sp.]